MAGGPVVGLVHGAMGPRSGARSSSAWLPTYGSLRPDPDRNLWKSRHMSRPRATPGTHRRRPDRWPSTDPTERALLLLSLLQTHRFWPGAELTERLGVSARTLRRDVDRLRVARLPGRRHARARPAATASPPARTSRRCCSTTTKPSPSRSGCAPRRARRSTAWRTPRCARWPSSSRCCPDRLAATGARGALERRVAAVGRRRRPSTPTPSRCSRSACRDHEQVRFDYRRRDGDELESPGRTPPARVDRAPVVPRGVGRAPRRLAHVPPRPPRAARGSRACAARRASCPAATRPRSWPSRSARCRCRTPRCSRSTRPPTRCATRSVGATPRSRSSAPSSCTRARRQREQRRARCVSSPGSPVPYPVVVREPDELAARVDQLVARLQR